MRNSISTPKYKPTHQQNDYHGGHHQNSQHQQQQQFMHFQQHPQQQQHTTPVQQESNILQSPLSVVDSTGLISPTQQQTNTLNPSFATR